jgi:mannose/fructose/N-acetylgalactosamine-specific phosphotransferase system component IIB
MPIVLYRVDERLIHGQVVVGWGAQLRPDGIIVIDDDVAASSWEQELYEIGLPPGLEREFVTVAQARERIAGWRAAPERRLLLTRDVHTMRLLAAGGLLEGEEINIGGIHYAAGREAVLPYVYLSADERAELRLLAEEGTRVTARDLPGTRTVELAELLDAR